MSLAVSSIGAECFHFAMMGVPLGTIAADRFPLSVVFLPFHCIFEGKKRKRKEKERDCENSWSQNC